MADLQSIREDLASPDEEVRYQAVRLSSTLGPDELRVALADVLGDDSWRVRKQAVALLARVVDDTTAWQLVQTGIGDPDNAGHRASALELLGELLPRLWFRLLQLSRDPSPALRKFAIDAVAAHPSVEALTLLEERLAEGDANVRAAAVEVVGRIDHPRSRGLLRQVVEERARRDALEVVAALHGLVELREDLPQAMLLPMLADPLLRPPALQLLARCPGTEVIELLVSALDPRSPSKARAAAGGLAERGRRGDEDLRSVAMALRRGRDVPQALRLVFQSHSLVDARAASVLAGWLADTELVADLYTLRRGRWVERDLMDALRRCGPERGVALANRLDSMEPGDQVVAIDALSVVADDTCLTPVERLLRFGRGQAAATAARCLGELGGLQRCASLEGLLSDSDATLAATCRIALDRIRARHGLVLAESPPRIPSPELPLTQRSSASDLGAVAPLSRGTFQTLRDAIRDRTGIHFAEDAVERLEMRLRPRLLELGIQQFEAYVQLLQRGEDASQAEFGALVERITTHETYFFREKHQLDAFVGEVLPDLKQRRQRDRRLRVWSAGCATGEEVYTLGMLIQDCGLFADWDIELVGSDIASTVIARARQGVYGDNSFRDDDRSYLERHFERQGDRFRIKDSLRRLTQFNVLNLLNREALGELPGFDAIFCRNVLIYFHQEAKLQLVDSFYKLLRPGGYLMLGHAESLLNLSTDFEVVPLRTDLVYRRPGAAQVAS
ncbi:MAG: CheR family methyltransferase [Pseudomonadota bacterium]